MGGFMVYLTITAFLVGVVGSTSIVEPDTYEPQVIPPNVHNARQLLGYDGFKTVASQPTGRRIKYAWELNVPEIKYNFGYGGKV